MDLFELQIFGIGIGLGIAGSLLVQALLELKGSRQRRERREYEEYQERMRKMQGGTS